MNGTPGPDPIEMREFVTPQVWIHEGLLHIQGSDDQEPRKYIVKMGDLPLSAEKLEEIQEQILILVDQILDKPFTFAKFSHKEIETDQGTHSVDNQNYSDALQTIMTKTSAVARKTFVPPPPPKATSQQIQALKNAALQKSREIHDLQNDYHKSRAQKAIDAYRTSSAIPPDDKIADELKSEYKEYAQCLNDLAKLQRNETGREDIKSAIKEVTDTEQLYSLNNHTSSVLHARYARIIAVVERGGKGDGAPTADQLQEILDQPLEEKVWSREEAIELNHEHDNILSWGGGRFLNKEALSRQGNWLPMREMGIRYSKNGRSHVTVTEIDPKSNLPSGVRDGSEKPVNVNKTTTYVLNDDGTEPEKKKVGWRIGQFSTINAAKEALKIMMDESEGKLDYYDNTLLTPTMLKPPWKDKLLLSKHFSNIKNALKELKEDPDYSDKIPKAWLRTNFGVNEGAQGELMLKGMKVPYAAGHISSLKHNNTFAKEFSKRIDAWIDSAASDSEKLGVLPAIVQLGQEMEAVWETNDYQRASVGHNQVKMPGLTRAMATLMGMTSNTHCMSAKDRASVVEVFANELLLEIEMNRLDIRAQIELEFVDPDPRLTSGLFTIQEVREIMQEGVDIDDAVEKKTQAAKVALRSEKGLMRQKFAIKQKPIRETKEGREAAAKFPLLSEPSIYDRSSPEERQRIQENRRKGLGPIGYVTRTNTAYAGSKVVGGEHLKIFYSGFDREYVLQRLNDKASPDELRALLGLSQVEEQKADQLLLELQDSKDPINVLKQIEDEKFESYHAFEGVKG